MTTHRTAAVTLGFSLIEILASTALSMLIISVTWIAFSKARKVAAKVQARVEMSSGARTVYESLRADLSLAQPNCAFWLISDNSAGAGKGRIELVFMRTHNDNFDWNIDGQPWNHWSSDLFWTRWSWDQATSTLSTGVSDGTRIGLLFGAQPTRTVAGVAETLNVTSFWMSPQPRRYTPGDLVSGLDENGWFTSQGNATGDYSHLKTKMGPANRHMTACEVQLVLGNGSVVTMDGNSSQSFCARGLRLDGLRSAEVVSGSTIDEYATRPALLRIRLSLRDPGTNVTSTFSFSFSLPGPLLHL